MKALSIQQPWAWAVIHAGKDVENRTWATSHRGDIAIHATSLQTDWTFPMGIVRPSHSELVLRAVIGVVEIVDVVSHSSSRWFTGPRAFVLKNPRPLPRPVACPGNQNVWELPAAVARAVEAQLGAGAVAPSKFEPAPTPLRWPEFKKQRQRAGTRWTSEEDATLLTLWNQSVPLDKIAARLHRGSFAVEVRLCKLGQTYFPSRPTQPTATEARFLTITQGNLDNNHIYLGQALDIFPKDVFGGPNAALAARSVRVHWNDQVVDTDIVRARIFRRRGWLRRFFAVNDIRAGDRVILERLGPYEYRLSKALDHRQEGCENG